MSSEKKIRAFLAIDPPAEVLREIGKIQQGLKKTCPFDVRWVNPEGMHLTLKFFGNVSEDDIIIISRIVGKNTTSRAPLQLEVKKLGLFPSLKRPKVLWIGLEGDIPPLLVLQKKLEDGLEEAGYAREGRPFRPHLTLGRIKMARCPGNPEQFMRDGGGCEAGSFLAGGLSLMKSDLTPRGAVYTRLGWFAFE